MYGDWYTSRGHPPTFRAPNAGLVQAVPREYTPTPEASVPVDRLKAMQESLRGSKRDNYSNVTDSCTMNPADAQFDLFEAPGRNSLSGPMTRARMSRASDTLPVRRYEAGRDPLSGARGLVVPFFSGYGNFLYLSVEAVGIGDHCW
jgi:hypothetical protein